METDTNDLNLEDVFINLRLISKINQGEKLLQSDKHINIDTSYFQVVTRWFRGASRNETINFIQKVLAKSFEFSDKLIEDDYTFELYEKGSEGAKTLIIKFLYYLIVFLFLLFFFISFIKSYINSQK
jgi:hypothetical protein